MLQPWRWFREHLDLSFRTGRGAFSVRIIERPGEWMESAALDDLVRDMRAVVRSHGKGALDYGVLTGSPERLSRCVLTIVYEAASGTPVAFNAISLLDVTIRARPSQVVHLGLVMVDPAFRERGLTWVLTAFTNFLLFVRRGFQPFWVSNVSQVPAAIGVMCEATVDAFPSPMAGARRSFEHLVIARQIMKRHRAAFGVGPEATFDENRFVIENAYTGGSDHLKKSFDEAPKHRDPAYNALCEQQLDYSRGDDFLQLGRVSLFTLYRSLVRDLPKEGVRTALTFLLYAAVDSILMPVLRWLDASKPYEDLRARGSGSGP
jgi:hypothetical protein